MDKPKAVLLLNASPRPKSTSRMLLERIQRLAGGELAQISREDPAALAQKMREADTIVLAGPCYINSWPSGVMRLMEEARKLAPFQGQKLYGIINGGMPYMHTHRHGLASLRFFAEQNDLTWQGGFVLGGGAMLDGQPLEKHMSHRKVVPAFDQFIQHIAEGAPSPDSLYEQAQPAPGKLVTRIFAHLLTFMVVKKLRKHGYDPDAPIC